MCHIEHCRGDKACKNERHSVNIKRVMIESVKVTETAIDSVPMKVPITILWPQKVPLELRARSGSTRELA